MASYRELTAILKAVLRAVHARNMSANGVLFETAMGLLREAEAGKIAEAPWTAFSEASPLRGGDEARIASAMRIGRISREEAIDLINTELDNQTLFVNSRYQVFRRDVGPGLAHLSIKRIDQEPIRSWRDLQRIKDELVGPDCEALELFPANDRLVDTANQYHLFAFTDPKYRLPFGFTERLVDDIGGGAHGQEPRT